MGKKCFVPNCSSGYRSCKERVSLFKVPKDPERIASWRRAIPRSDRELQPGDCVCEKHFSPHLISRAYHVEHEGKVLLDAPKRSVLSSEAVPTIFPNCPKYMSAPLKPPRKAPRKRPGVSLVARPKRHRSLSLSQTDCSTAAVAGTTQQVGTDTTQRAVAPTIGKLGCTREAVEIERNLQPTSACSPYPAEAVDESTEERDLEKESKKGETFSETAGSLSFSTLFACAREVRLPGGAWGTHVTDAFGTKSVAFSKLEPSRVPGAEPLQAKTMTVSCDSGQLQLKTFIWGSLVDLSDRVQTSDIKNISDIACTLQAFDNVHACEGGPAGECYPDVRPECASIDRWGVWRHIRCSLYTAGTQCDACQRLRDTLRIHASRKKKGKGKRTRLLLSPSKKLKIDALRKARISSYRSNMRLLAWKKKIKEELATCRAKLASLDDETVASVTEKVNLPEPQALVLKACMAASRQSKQGRRYTDDWILFVCSSTSVRRRGTDF